MRNCIYLLVLAVTTLLFSCDKEADTYDTSYVQFQISFVNPSTDTQKYRILFNGTDIKNGTGVCKKNQTGTLEVYNTIDNASELKKEITIQGNENIQLIKLPNSKVDVYDDKDYVSFKVSISYIAGKENAYDVKFNGIPLTNGTNYCKSDEATGDVDIFLKGTQDILFSLKGITVSDLNGINLMQLSDTEFIQVPIDDEPNPESKRYTKVRFFYTPDALPSVEAVKLVIYAYPATSIDEFNQVATVDEIKVNEFSKYITLDQDYYQESRGQQVGFCYDLINLATGEKIIDYNIQTDTYIGLSDNMAKQTVRIENGGMIMIRVPALSTPW